MFMKLGVSTLGCLVLLAFGCDSKTGDGQTAVQANVPQTASASQSSSPSSPANVNNTASPQPSANLSTRPAASTGFLDACAMIEKSEIASVQGAPVQSEVPSTQAGNALAISQCYYTVASADGSKNLSVHLEVIQADPKGSNPKAVKDYWERAFGEKRKGEEGEEKEASKPPQPVSGVGEEAFWIGNAKVGALYALKKDKMVRLSIGGAYDPKTRLEKSKMLIENVLKRLA
jgi:hypothetical protein